jgi:capsular exopolysaccharide synthesis family protein
VLRRQRSPAEPSRTPSATQGEAFRVLRSNLAVALSDLERRIVIVTSAFAGEGKTATTVNLARSMADAGQRVVVVDLDLRHPDTHRWLGAHNEFGVSDVLLDERPLEQALQFVEVRPGSRARGLYLLSTGRPVANPTELLGSRRTALLLDALVSQADIILIDTPPVLLVADTLVIGRMAAGALLVAEVRRTPTAAVQRAKDSLIRNQTRLLGLVLNKFQTHDSELGYGYGYGYEYGYPTDEHQNGERELDAEGFKMPDLGSDPEPGADGPAA